MTTDTLTITEDQKAILWAKIEYRKKKTAIEEQNDLFKWFIGSKTEFSSAERTAVLKSLEYTFKMKLLASTDPVLASIAKKLV